MEQKTETGPRHTKFKRWIFEHGVSQAELSDKSGFSKGLISQIVVGMPPKQDWATQIIKALQDMGHKVEEQDIFDVIRP